MCTVFWWFWSDFPPMNWFDFDLISIWFRFDFNRFWIWYSNRGGCLRHFFFEFCLVLRDVFRRFKVESPGFSNHLLGQNCVLIWDREDFLRFSSKSVIWAPKIWVLWEDFRVLRICRLFSRFFVSRGFCPSSDLPFDDFVNFRLYPAWSRLVSVLRLKNYDFPLNFQPSFGEIAFWIDFDFNLEIVGAGAESISICKSWGVVVPQAIRMFPNLLANFSSTPRHAMPRLVGTCSDLSRLVETCSRLFVPRDVFSPIWRFFSNFVPFWVEFTLILTSFWRFSRIFCRPRVLSELVATWWLTWWSRDQLMRASLPIFGLIGIFWGSGSLLLGVEGLVRLRQEKALSLKKKERERQTSYYSNRKTSDPLEQGNYVYYKLHRNGQWIPNGLVYETLKNRDYIIHRENGCPLKRYRFHLRLMKGRSEHKPTPDALADSPPQPRRSTWSKTKPQRFRCSMLRILDSGPDLQLWRSSVQGPYHETKLDSCSKKCASPKKKEKGDVSWC